MLAVYFASKTKEEYNNAPVVNDLGWLVLALPWLSGFFKIGWDPPGGLAILRFFFQIQRYSVSNCMRKFVHL